MASEEHDDGAVSFAVPPDVGDWIDEQADSREETPEAFCRHVLMAIHTASESADEEPVDRSDLEELEARVNAQREEFRDLLEDVRDRVVQVKIDVDERAPTDHDHDEYTTAATVAEIRDDLVELADRLDAGFDNFEEILERVFEETDGLDRRSTELATTVLDLREHQRVLLTRERTRAKADELRLAGNRLGIERAVCEECDSSVSLALLTRPECPHCASSFADVRTRASIFGSHTLETGDPPALEGRVADEFEPEPELEPETETTETTTWSDLR